MRDRLIHQYFGVNWDILWDVVVDGPPRNLIGCRPPGIVAQGGDGEPLPRVASGVAHDTIQPAIPFRIIPGAVVVRGLKRDEEVPGAQPG
jgi:hypothetical protein